MTLTLRILLLTAALLTAIWILRKIKKTKVKLEDSIFWICFAVILAILGLFPRISYFMTKLLGIQSPANCIFLCIIFMLLEKVFTLSLKVSLLEEKLVVLTAEVAIRTKKMDEIEMNNKMV